MTTIEKSVDVAAPVRTAYNQWTQFESFPSFMDGVERITQETPTRTHWRTVIGGVIREFDAEITEQHPDERIAWHSVDGPHHAGVVTFHRIDDSTTRVHLQMEYAPDSLPEKAGTALGVVGHRIQGDLRRFKEFIEAHGTETGAWRGEVDRPAQEGEHPAAARGGTSGRSIPPTGTDPDFAAEHSRPTYANEPNTEGPDESVPRGRGGAGGMDV
jgi:ribosome-associated toxin RatA of RatAB toxin-antitoxin module